ncbi:MAG: UDP-N-acetylmuramoyl-L-alanine--D-glutamate ligase [Gammaproteobacteria bacterium]|nr:UDP-N-acetylmuramoyl-L-alanine--D-glutamate ligase [Gammaproteobacteria bacterium]
MASEAVKTVIIGLGKTGLSCARYLTAQGYDITVVDSRKEPPGLEVLKTELPHIPVILGSFEPAVLAKAELLVISPGVPLNQPAIAEAVARGVPVVGDIELFAQTATAPVVAITGSNGKSTVTTLVYEMARQAGRNVRAGGNLGTPALDLLQDHEPDLYVLELSSFQLETTHSLNAVAATVLNISQDHLDRYQDMDEYIAAKYRIFQGGGVVIINLDDPVVNQWQLPGRNCLRFGLKEPELGSDFGLRQYQGESWLAQGNELLMPQKELRIAGMHNVANALAALALGAAIGLPCAAMIETLRVFKGLPHRCQWVAEQEGVTWYNDSKATNVGAAVAAINGMPGKVVLVAGGLGKGQDFRPLQPVAADKCRAVILIGKDAPQLKAALGDVVPVFFAANLGEVVAKARTLAQPGDAVLLSPACASFDMFSGYEDRGEQFAAAVLRTLM